MVIRAGHLHEAKCACLLLTIARHKRRAATIMKSSQNLQSGGHKKVIWPHYFINYISPNIHQPYEATARWHASQRLLIKVTCIVHNVITRLTDSLFSLGKWSPSMYPSVYDFGHKHKWELKLRDDEDDFTASTYPQSVQIITCQLSFVIWG